VSNREPGGVMGVNENCVDKIMYFLENTLKIEDAKSIQIEKAYRLGKLCLIVQDVRTCLIRHTKGSGNCVRLCRMSEPV